MPRCLFAILILLLSLPTTAGEEESSWQVSEPVGPWRDISIDTETTTWSFVDVSPDGETLVFDMLGDIYSMPIEGGEVTALTSGIEWNFQPAFSPDGRFILSGSSDNHAYIWEARVSRCVPLRRGDLAKTGVAQRSGRNRAHVHVRLHVSG